MRWNLKRTKLLFALIPIISIVFYIWTANGNIYANQTFIQFDIYQQISDTAKPVAGKNSPADYTAAENFAIAADVYLAAPAAESATTGTIETLGGLYTQTVRNRRTRTGGELFCESVSLSSIASVAEQRYFKDGALLYRAGNARGGEVKSWENSVTELTVAGYRQRYGVVPQEITKYSVTEQSIQSGQLVAANADGTYTFELIMDAEKAQKFSRYEMMTFAGVSAFPEFLSCRLVFTIDENWRIRTLESYDVYKIDIMGGITCDSHLTETYAYNDIAMPERAQIFIDYVPTGNTGNVTTQKGPADYLSEAFGDYITGQKKLCLTADLRLMGQSLPIAAAIDISKNDFRFAVGDDVFAAYANDTLYIRLGESKIRLTADDLSYAAKTLGIDLGGLQTGDTDILSLLFADSSMYETETHAHIVMPFELFGIGFNVDMGLRKTADGKYAADTIDAAVSVRGLRVYAAVRIADTVALPDFTESEYVSMRPLLDSIAGTMQSQTYLFRLDGAVTATDESAASEPFSAVVTLRRPTQNENAALACTLHVSGQTVEIVYKDGYVYLRAGEIALKLAIADTKSLLSALTPLLGDAESLLKNAAPLLGFDAQTVIDALRTVLPLLTDTASKPNIGALLPKLDFLLPPLSVNGLLSTLTGVRIAENTFVLPVTPENGESYTLRLEADGKTLTGASLHGLTVKGLRIDADVTVSCDAQFSIDVDESEYFDLYTLNDFAPALHELLTADTFELQLREGLLQSSLISGTVEGAVRVSLQPFSLQADLSFRSHKIGLVYDGKTFYVRVNDIRASFTAQDIDALRQELEKYITADEQTASDIMLQTLETATLLQSVLGGKTLGELFAHVTYFAPCDGGCTIGFNAGEFSATVALTASASALHINVLNFNYGADIYDSYLYATLSPLPALPVVSLDESEYVRLADLQSYVTPVVQTLHRTHYAVAFAGTVKDATVTETDTAGVTKIEGELKLQRTAAFADIYARIGLSGKTSDQNITLYLIDNAERRTADGETEPAAKETLDLSAYIDYNGFRAKIEYVSLLRILGAITDILDLNIPLLDELTRDVYERTNTDVFRTMDIAGLNELRETLNGLFAATEDATDAAANGGLAALLGLISDDMIDSVLSGLSLGWQNEQLQVRIDNGIFNELNRGKRATVTLKHDGEYLTRVEIDNLVANGDTVHFFADFSTDIFDRIVPPEGVKDFSSIDELLLSVIRTADLRDFHITGSVKLNVMNLIKPNIPFDVKVKILDDGSTVAAVKLQVPFVSAVFGVGLYKTDSYLYFANNRLYFIADVWDSRAWGAGSYKTTEMKSATVEEFLANPLDYLFFLLRMGSMIQNPIQNAIASGGNGTPSNDLNDIFKAYSFNGTEFAVTLGLGELTGNKDLKDLHVTLSAADGYITGLGVDTQFTNMNVTLSVTDTRLDLVKDKDGKITAGELGTVEFGKGTGDKTFIGTLEHLEDDLSQLFPTDAAETFAEKADAKTQKVKDAAKQAENATQRVTDAVQEEQEAHKEYLAAKQKRLDTPENSFGYERALAREERTERVWERAQQDVTDALDARIESATKAADAAVAAYAYAEKAADAAERALAYAKTATETAHAVRAFNAAGQAANATANVFQAARDALQAAIRAATDAGDDGKDALTYITAIRESILEKIPVTALRTVNVALSDCDVLIAATQTYAAQANTYAKAGDWIQAADGARITLSSVAALQTAIGAAHTAATYANADAQAAVNDKDTDVQKAVSATALETGTVAVDAAKQLSAWARVDINAAEDTVAVDPIAAVNKFESALCYGQKAAEAIETAQKADKLMRDDALLLSIQNAAQTVNANMAYVGETGIGIAPSVTEKLIARTRTATGNTANDLIDAAAALNAAKRLCEYAQNAYAYAESEQNARTVQNTKIQATTVATNVLTQYADTAYATAQAAVSALEAQIQTTKAECDYSKIGYKLRYDEVRNVAENLTAKAETAYRIAEAVTGIADDAGTLFAQAHGSATAAANAEKVKAVLDDENTRWVGTAKMLQNAAKTESAKSIGTDLMNRADGMRDDLDSQKKAKAQVQAAAQTAQSRMQRFIGNPDAAYGSFSMLAKILFQY